jgi:hypothetical protein
MCLDPRPDRLVRPTRSIRRLSSRAPVLAHALHVPGPAPIVRPPALWALDTLAGDDDLVARGWVVLSRDH